MPELEIYYCDLTPEATEAFCKMFGSAEKFNHDDVPLFIYSREEEVENNV